MSRHSIAPGRRITPLGFPGDAEASSWSHPVAHEVVGRLLFFLGFIQGSRSASPARPCRPSSRPSPMCPISSVGGDVAEMTVDHPRHGADPRNFQPGALKRTMKNVPVASGSPPTSCNWRIKSNMKNYRSLGSLAKSPLSRLDTAPEVCSASNIKLRFSNSLVS